MRVMDALDMRRIDRIFDDVPVQSKGMMVMSEVRSEYYRLMMALSVDEVLSPAVREIRGKKKVAESPCASSLDSRLSSVEGRVERRQDRR